MTSRDRDVLAFYFLLRHGTRVHRRCCAAGGAVVSACDRARHGLREAHAGARYSMCSGSMRRSTTFPSTALT